MENQIIIDFNALDRIAKKLNTASSDLESAMSILSGIYPTQASGAYLRLSGSTVSLKSVGGTVSAYNVTQAIENYRRALKRLSFYSRSLATGVNTTGIRFRQNEQTTAGQPAGIGALIDGYEFSREGFIPTTTHAWFFLKILGDDWESSFINIKQENAWSVESGNGFKPFNKGVKDWLEDKGLRRKLKDDTTYIKDGEKIEKKDSPTFYDRYATIAEIGDKVSASASLYEGSRDFGDWGSGSLTVGKAEAYAGWSAGLYVLGADKDGKIVKKFSPGVKAEVGASVTAFEANYDKQVVGDDNLGVNIGATVTAGKVSAKGEGVVQIFDESGKLNVQAGVSGSLEAIAGEASLSGGVNVLGGEVGVKGSVNYGIGAHADIGYRNGVFKFDVGATLGVGASVSAELDVGGMINTVVDTASSAWEGISKGWDSFVGLLGGGW